MIPTYKHSASNLIKNSLDENLDEKCTEWGNCHFPSLTHRALFFLCNKTRQWHFKQMKRVEFFGLVAYPKSLTRRNLIKVKLENVYLMKVFLSSSLLPPPFSFV